MQGALFGFTAAAFGDLAPSAAMRGDLPPSAASVRKYAVLGGTRGGQMTGIRRALPCARSLHL